VTEAFIGAPAEPVGAAAPGQERHAILPHWGMVLLCFAAASGYYALLLNTGSSGFFKPIPHGLAFNSMLLHLLDGRFDIDPVAIGFEGYVRDGVTYSYFGVFPALLRVIFLPLPDFAAIDFTRLSCLVAVCLMALFKIFSAFAVWRRAGTPQASILLSLLVAAILMSGPQIQFLRPSIFQEVVMWAGAFSAAFVFLVLLGWTRENGFTPGLLVALALTAGLCLLTRVSTALGLYLAFGFLWLGLCWREVRRPAGMSPWPRLTALSLPLAILVAFAAVAALINYERWGNPLVFVDLTLSIAALEYPDRLVRLHEYGAFNLIRLGFGLVYYFLPIWVLRDGTGQLLWSEFQHRTVDVELPPSSFFFSDPLLIGLAAYGITRLFRRPAVVNRGLLGLVIGGLAVPALLMLTAIAMNFRYRMEFYPLFELCAFVGFASLIASPTPRPRITFGIAAVAGIITAHAVWVVSALSPFGPAEMVMGSLGILDFYRSQFH
jgi:hypothetical protein